MADILIAVGIALLTAVMAYMGVHVTLHPPIDAKKGQWRYGFILVGIAAVALIALQTWRNGASQAALHVQLNKIQHNTETPPLPPVVNVNIPPQASVPVKVTPIPTITYRSIPSGTLLNAPPSMSSPPTKPGVDIVATAKGDIPSPTFEAECDRPCVLVQAMAISDATRFNVLDTGNPNVSRIEFVIPATLPSGHQIIFSYQSRDNKPIYVKSFRLVNSTGHKG